MLQHFSTQTTEKPLEMEREKFEEEEESEITRLMKKNDAENSKNSNYKTITINDCIRSRNKTILLSFSNAEFN